MASDVSPEDLFECQQCGDCCKGYGGTYVTDQDIQNIAEFIKTDPKTFVADYCHPSGKKYVLTQGENGYCVFWDKICTIHPVKPRMCKAWPFIEAVLIDERNWEVMGASCPGIRTNVSDIALRKCIEQKILKTGSNKSEHQQV